MRTLAGSEDAGRGRPAPRRSRSGWATRHLRPLGNADLAVPWPASTATASWEGEPSPGASFLSQTRSDSGGPDPQRGRAGPSEGTNCIPDLLQTLAGWGRQYQRCELVLGLFRCHPRDPTPKVSSRLKSGVENDSPFPSSLPPLTFVHLFLASFPKGPEQIWA